MEGETKSLLLNEVRDNATPKKSTVDRLMKIALMILVLGTFVAALAAVLSSEGSINSTVDSTFGTMAGKNTPPAKLNSRTLPHTFHVDDYSSIPFFFSFSLSFPIHFLHHKSLHFIISHVPATSLQTTLFTIFHSFTFPFSLQTYRPHSLYDFSSPPSHSSRLNRSFISLSAFAPHSYSGQEPAAARNLLGVLVHRHTRGELSHQRD